MRTNKAVWYVAAGTATLTAVYIAVAVIDRFAGVTWIDMGALLVTGMLAGLFLGVALKTT